MRKLKKTIAKQTGPAKKPKKEAKMKKEKKTEKKTEKKKEDEEASRSDPPARKDKETQARKRKREETEQAKLTLERFRAIDDRAEKTEALLRQLLLERAPVPVKDGL